MQVRLFAAMLTIFVSMLGCDAHAAVSADEAKALGGPLTVFGAEKAGNKEGTIPAYTGEGVKPPPSFDPKDGGQRPDPFNEKPLFSITAQNADKYADKLDGYITMFKRYPNYRMDVYPTHRTMRLPKNILDNSVKNATSCKTAQDEQDLAGCYGGVPFPIPKSGAEAMWNHLMSFGGVAKEGSTSSWVVTSTGGQVMATRQYALQSSPVFEPSYTTVLKGSDVVWRARMDFTGPARKVGEKLVVMYFVSPYGYPARIFQYIPGQRRVKLAPDLAYDTPSPTAGGVGTMDEGKGFLGALDRFNWKLVGKKEKYIMYNNFVLGDAKSGCTDEKVLTKNFANPDCVRWELHRVWVVEGNLKPGFRHIYKRRIFYWDEDSHSAGSVEEYDSAGQLYRMVNLSAVPQYDGYGMDISGSLFYDLQTGQWAFQAAIGAPGMGWRLVDDKSDLYYSPEALAAEGIR